VSKSSYNPVKPYNQLPMLPLQPELTVPVFLAAIGANRALAELKGAARLIPDPSILIHSLTLREARDSSDIENIVTTHDDLYRLFSAEGSADPAVTEVLRYRQALWTGFGLVKKLQLLTMREIRKMQEILVGNSAGIRRQPGTTLKNPRTGEVIYTPPSGKDVLDRLLGNLESYINTGTYEPDALIRMAIIHYQFESIHPFYDGNGRTGRMINLLYLIHAGLLDLPVLYMSAYIARHRKKYMEGLDLVRRENQWEGWLLFMLGCVEATAKDTMGTIEAIKALMEQTSAAVKKKKPKIYSAELVDIIFHQPYSRIIHLQKHLSVSRFTASKYLQELQRLNILKAEKAGRDVLYLNVGLMKILKTELRE
jgi:Fic family protein